MSKDFNIFQNFEELIEAEKHISKAVSIFRSIDFTDDDILEKIFEKIKPRNRFVIFASEQYYPSGGFEDFITSSPTLEEAKLIAKKLKKDFIQIIDFLSLKEVYSNYDEEGENE